MTIIEAKKVIEMCADILKKTHSDGKEGLYVNREYVLNILDMVNEDVHQEISPPEPGPYIPGAVPILDRFTYTDSSGQPPIKTTFVTSLHPGSAEDSAANHVHENSITTAYNTAEPGKFCNTEGCENTIKNPDL